MNGIRIARGLRALRIRAAKRQSDVAREAGVSRSLVAKVESGRITSVDLRRLEAVCTALGADLDVRVRWRGESLDRLLDEAHARLVETLVVRLTRLGWECVVEVTFNEFGERGSVDVLGWHAAARSVLICEVKSLIANAQETIGTHDRKSRLGWKIARAQGREPVSVSRLLAVAASTTNRRRIAQLEASFRAAYRTRGVAVNRWLRQPVGSISGLVFLPDDTPGGIRAAPTGRTRVNRPGSARKPRQTPQVAACGRQSSD